MSSIEFVELAAARTARGLRMVVPRQVPSPWTEAAKGMFRVQGASVLAVRSSRDPELAAWTRAPNAPVVFYEDEPPRTVWSQILALAVRLGPPGALVPEDVDRRAALVGMIHELAGEGGLGWSARLLMIHASFASNGARGFPLPIAKYLATSYGYAPDRIEAAGARVREVLDALARRLGTQDYFDGDKLSALDIYSATFLTPLSVVEDADCPDFLPVLKSAFATAREDLGGAVPAALMDHRRRMFERHLAWPIQL